MKMEKIKYSSNSTRVMIAEQKGIIVEWAIAASKAVGYPKSFDRAIANIKDDLDVLETMILHYATMVDE